MDDERPLFVLAGNGPYANRGYEAIVRGTTKILREHFKDPRSIGLSHFQNGKQYQQCLQETDEANIHLHSYRLNKREIAQNFWEPFLSGLCLRPLSPPRGFKIQDLQAYAPYLDDTAAALSVGGDNYSLDYGVPRLFTGLDDTVRVLAICKRESGKESQAREGNP